MLVDCDNNDQNKREFLSAYCQNLYTINYLSIRTFRHSDFYKRTMYIPASSYSHLVLQLVLNLNGQYIRPIIGTSAF